jgi:hypothetical protein
MIGGISTRRRTDDASPTSLGRKTVIASYLSSGGRCRFWNQCP